MVRSALAGSLVVVETLTTAECSDVIGADIPE